MFSKKLKVECAESFDKTVNPVFYHIIPFLSSNDTANFAGVSRIMRSLYKNEIPWRNLYLAHYGVLYSHEDYRAQYIAYYLFKTANTDLPWGYEKLNQHIQSYRTKKWAFYYCAYLANEDYLSDRSPIEYALEALKAGDLKAISTLIDFFYDQLKHNKPINEQQLNQALVLFTANNKKNENITNICLLYCIMSKNSIDPANIAQFEETARHYFVNNLMAENPAFPDFLSYLLKILGAHSKVFIALAIEKIRQLPNTIEKVGYLLKNDVVWKPQLLAWMKDLADKGNAVAAYHYAKNAPLENKKIYFIQALKGGERRAIQKLNALVAKTITENELVSLFMNYIKIGDQECIHILAAHFRKHKKWDQDAFKVWILQESACLESAESHPSYDALIKKLQYPETHLFVRCALALVYVRRNNDLEPAQHVLAFALHIDEQITKRYLDNIKKYDIPVNSQEAHFENIKSPEKLQSKI